MFPLRLSLVKFTMALVCFVPARPVLSQGDVPASDADQQVNVQQTVELPQENPADWQYQATLSLPDQDVAAPTDLTIATDLVDLFVPAEVLGHARHDLSDLRLEATNGSPIPFAVRTLSAKTVINDLTSTTFNRAQSDSGDQEVTLEFTGNAITHNQVVIEASGKEFRRVVVVEGSDDGQDWKRLVQGFILKLSDENHTLTRSTLRYQDSRHRFLRVQVAPDPQLTTSGTGTDRFEIDSLRVSQQLEIPAVRVVTVASLGSREPTRQYGSTGSRWIIDFGSVIPVEGLQISIEDREFVRDVSLEAETPNMLGQPSFDWVYPSQGGTWQRQKTDALADLEMTFSEVQTRRLRLTVADYRNKPLNITGAKGIISARQIVFQRPHPTMFPLKLRFGNPDAESPNYDFARNLAPVLPTTPIRAVLGPLEPNPDYLAPPQPFTERYPWFIYLTLGTVCLVLGAVVWNLSQVTMARLA
ncbi:MAG: DUF3999 family protein [Pirellulaceae bacterium]|nr:DUF3999 family protein [Pirellulaceae bacterium]